MNISALIAPDVSGVLASRGTPGTRRVRRDISSALYPAASRGFVRRPSAPRLSSCRSSFAGNAMLSLAARVVADSSRRRRLTVRADAGELYGEVSFHDVDNVLVNYFTFRALKETLGQIAETDLTPNKEEYKWLYQFASENNPNDSQKFMKSLFAVRPDYGQRILTQRQSLLARWRKTFDGSAVAESIEKQNLEHLRDQLFATVNLSEESLSMEDESECLTEEEKAANCVQESEGEIA